MTSLNSKLLAAFVLLSGCLSTTTATAQSSNPYADGSAAAPDEWLLIKKGSPWWYTTKPSPTPMALRQRTPTVAEQAVIDRAHSLLVNRPAKAFALLDGDAVLYSETKAPADAESVFFGFSMGKTVTAMAVGQAICANKLKLDTKASDVMPELGGKALGAATVHDLLRMASGAADPNPDSSVWTPEQFKEWGQGNLNLLKLITEDRVAKAAKGGVSDHKSGEEFSYKSTDPYVLGLMVSRVTNTPWSQWIQEKILNPMGAAHPGLYVQDRQQNGLADSGLRMRLDDWMRFAVWVKRSSKEQGCFGDFVRAATRTQISNGRDRSTRKIGKLFGGYGYFTWTDNPATPNTAWASGWGGQRISWHRDSDRMVVTFSNFETWMPEVHEVARDWNAVAPLASASQPASKTTTPVAVAPPNPATTWQGPLSGKIEFQSITPPDRWQFVRKNLDNTKAVQVHGDLLLPTQQGGKVPTVVISHDSGGVTPKLYELWVKALNAAGVAVFIPDSFKPRDIDSSTHHQGQVDVAANVADALNALKLLATHPQIDAGRIFHMGGSRGGAAAFETQWDMVRQAVISDGLKFAGYVTLYQGNCNTRFRFDRGSARPAPMLALLGGADDGAPADACVAYFTELNRGGAHIRWQIYPDAHHNFDGSTARTYLAQVMTAKNCAIEVFMTDVKGGGLGEARDYKTGQPIQGFGEWNRAFAACNSRGFTVGENRAAREQAIRDVLAFIKATPANPGAVPNGSSGVGKAGQTIDAGMTHEQRTEEILRELAAGKK